MARTILTPATVPAAYPGSAVAVSWAAADVALGNRVELTGKESILLRNTDALAAASCAIGSGDNGTVTVTQSTPGTTPNGRRVVVVIAGTPNASLSAAVVAAATATCAVDDILVTLGTDALGDPDDAKNTATLVAAAIDALSPVSAVASGTGATALDEAETATFNGGSVTPHTLTVYTVATQYGQVTNRALTIDADFMALTDFQETGFLQTDGYLWLSGDDANIKIVVAREQ
jgi:hypothetical protein